MSRSAPVNVKLTDFGTARAVTLTITKNAKMTVGMGTPVYMVRCSRIQRKQLTRDQAPEVLNPKGLASYDEKSDVFSFGVLLYELFTQSEPYKEFTHAWSKWGGGTTVLNLTDLQLSLNLWMKEKDQKFLRNSLL